MIIQMAPSRGYGQGTDSAGVHAGTVPDPKGKQESRLRSVQLRQTCHSPHLTTLAFRGGLGQWGKRSTLGFSLLASCILNRLGEDPTPLLASQEAVVVSSVRSSET